jgi:hypothetical protein
MSIFEMKVSIDPSVDAAIEVERVVRVVVAQIRTGQPGAEVLNAQGHVCGGGGSRSPPRWGIEAHGVIRLAHAERKKSTRDNSRLADINAKLELLAPAIYRHLTNPECRPARDPGLTPNHHKCGISRSLRPAVTLYEAAQFHQCDWRNNR